MANWLFDGVALQSQPGLTLAPGTQLQTAVARRMETVTISGVDGVTPPLAPAVYDSRQVQIVVNVDGASETEIAARALNATAILTSTKVLTRVHGGQSVTAACVLQDLGESKPDRVDQHVELTATYLIPGTFFGTPETSSTASVDNDQIGALFSRTFPNATAPQPGFRLLLGGPITYVKVSDENTGQWVEWSGTVAQGQYLSIDTETTTTTAGGVDARAGLRMSPYGGRLQPDRNGTVNMRLIRTGGAGVFYMYFRPRYF